MELQQDLSGNVVLFPSNSSARVVDLAVTPDGKRLITVGRVNVDVSATPPSSSAASQNSSNTSSVNNTSSSMAKCDKRITVYNLIEKKFE